MIDGAIVRTDHTNINGFGKIATLSFIVKSNLSNIETSTFGILSYKAITASDSDLILSSQSSNTITFTPNVTGSYDKSLNSFNMFPNPNNGIVNISYNIETSEKAEVEICDIAGRKLFSKVLRNDQHFVVIDNNDLTNGVYLCRFVMNDRTLRTERFVVVK